MGNAALKIEEPYYAEPRVLETPLTLATVTRIEYGAIKKLFRMGFVENLMHSKQLELLRMVRESTAEDFLIFCGRQWGKTHFGLCYAISYCISNPGSRVLYYAPVREKLADIVNDGLEQIIPWAPRGLIVRRKSSHRWAIGKSQLRLCVLERAHVGRNRGINAKGLIVIEEGCFISSDDFKYAYENIIEPQRLRWKPKLFIITTPSEDENHYVHKVLLPRAYKEKALANYSIYDNPFLSLETIEKVKAKVTEETWLREYLGKITRSSSLLAVPEFNRDAIKKLTPPVFANWLTGIDCGGVTDPHGGLLTYFDFQRAKFCIYREFPLPVNTLISDIATKAIEVEKERTHGQHSRVVDCKGQLGIEFDNLHFVHYTPDKGPGSFEAALNALRIGFQNGEIEVDESCEQTIMQLLFGKLNKRRTDFAHSEEMGHLDQIAALMYAYQHRDKTTNPFPHMFRASDYVNRGDLMGLANAGQAQQFRSLHDVFE